MNAASGPRQSKRRRVRDDRVDDAYPDPATRTSTQPAPPAVGTQPDISVIHNVTEQLQEFQQGFVQYVTQLVSSHGTLQVELQTMRQEWQRAANSVELAEAEIRRLRVAIEEEERRRRDVSSEADQLKKQLQQTQRQRDRLQRDHQTLKEEQSVKDKMIDYQSAVLSTVIGGCGQAYILGDLVHQEIQKQYRTACAEGSPRYMQPISEILAQAATVEVVLQVR